MDKSICLTYLCHWRLIWFVVLFKLHLLFPSSGCGIAVVVVVVVVVNAGYIETETIFLNHSAAKFDLLNLLFRQVCDPVI